VFTTHPIGAAGEGEECDASRFLLIPAAFTFAFQKKITQPSEISSIFQVGRSTASENFERQQQQKKAERFF
jgi:hypothetical protein